MSFLTDLRTPGTGRRQAGRCERLAGDNARLRSRARRLENDLHQTAFQLGELAHALLAERDAHQETRQLLRAALDVNDALQHAVKSPRPAASPADADTIQFPTVRPLATALGGAA